MALVIIVTLALVVGIIVSVMPKGVNKQSKTVRITNPEIDNHNECIHTYNHINNAYNTKVQKKQSEIIAYRDQISYDKLMYITKEVNDEMDVANDYIMRSADLIGRNDYAGSGYCIDKCKEILEEMQKYIKYIDAIHPEQQVNFKKPQVNIVETKVSRSGFFEGCITKEEADARYKSLCKALHPDSKGGSAEMFENMKKEYDSLSFERQKK